MVKAKLVAAISISILLASVLCNPFQPVFADINHINEINKKKKLAEEQAKRYVKGIGITSGNWNPNSTSTNEVGKNVKNELEKAMKISEEKANQYLKTIGPLKKNLAAKINYNQFNYTSTNEIGKNVKNELEKAKKASEEKANALLEKLFPRLNHKKYS
jgi:predicted Zn-dependent protease